MLGSMSLMVESTDLGSQLTKRYIEGRFIDHIQKASRLVTGTFVIFEMDQVSPCGLINNYFRVA